MLYTTIVALYAVSAWGQDAGPAPNANVSPPATCDGDDDRYASKLFDVPASKLADFNMTGVDDCQSAVRFLELRFFELLDYHPQSVCDIPLATWAPFVILKKDPKYETLKEMCCMLCAILDADSYTSEDGTGFQVNSNGEERRRLGAPVSAPTSSEKRRRGAATSAPTSSERRRPGAPTSAPTSSERRRPGAPTSVPTSSERIRPGAPTSVPTSSEKRPGAPTAVPSYERTAPDAETPTPSSSERRRPGPSKWCWRDSYERSVSEMGSECARGTERVGLMGLCYKLCPKGFDRARDGKGNALMVECVQTCPSGWTDLGLHCTINGNHGRSHWRDGFPWHTGDKLASDDGMISRCEAKHGKGNCEKQGLIYYPKCHIEGGELPKGMSWSGLTHWCRPIVDCEAVDMKKGFQITGRTCTKRLPILWPGLPGIQHNDCPSGTDRIGDLCYEECRAGHNGFGGKICWRQAPDGWVECGMGASQDRRTCFTVIPGPEKEYAWPFVLNVGLEGECEDPASEPITTLERCREASRVLSNGNVLDKGRKDWPAGCFQWKENGGVYFNTRPRAESLGVTKDRHHVICVYPKAYTYPKCTY